MVHFRLNRAVSAFAAALMLVSCGGGGGGGGDATPTGPTGSGNPPPANGNVTVTNNSFTPGDVTVAAGSTVTWTWNSCTGGDGYGSGETCYEHNVQFDAGPSSETKSSGVFARAFPAAGTYPYHCAVHGAAMSGRVIVQ
jgi:plastocyanin